jgi:tRNA (mo5U34)-methyltransferase
MDHLSPSEIQRTVDAVRHWHHIIHFPHGIVSPGSYDPRSLFDRLALPDLHGKRVLDVGTRDGFFAFACERLGAEVVAIDHTNPVNTGFQAAREILGSSVEYVQANVYTLEPEELGSFDVILFLGVLYHLRHPLLALDRLRALSRGLLFVESLVCDQGIFTDLQQAQPLAAVAPGLVDIPIAQFLPFGRFHPDWTNKWSPNVACLRALVEDSLFTVEDVQTWGDRALIRAVAQDSPELRRRAELDRGLEPKPR